MSIAKTIAGGDPRTLKGVDAVIRLVSTKPEKLSELFECLFDPDQIVRMRAGDALEKICKQHPDWFEPYTTRLLTEVAAIQQPSVQWHLAQMLAEIKLTKPQSAQAITILKNNLHTSDDWIVVNLTLESLATFVRNGSLARGEFMSLLKKAQRSPHKSVLARVQKLTKEFGRG